MRFGRLAAVATAGLVGIASATGIISERPPVSTKQISADINNALAKAGLDASESEKIRQAYHVGVGQIDDESDESRQALSGALSKILASDTVKHINADINHVVDTASSVVERDQDASAGFAPVDGGVAAHHNGVDATPTSPSPTVENVLLPRKNLSPPVHNRTNTNITLDVPTECDCKKVIDSVVEPKPEGGMSQAWFIDWKKDHYPQGDLSTRCIKSCVDESIHTFIKKIKEFQAAEQLSSKPVPAVHTGGPDNNPVAHPKIDVTGHPGSSGGLIKREKNPVVVSWADMYNKVRAFFYKSKPNAALGSSKPKVVDEHDLEKFRDLFASFNSSKIFKTTKATTACNTTLIKELAEYVNKPFPQADEKTLLTYRQWREAFLKLNKKLNTAKKGPESVSSSGVSEESGVSVR
jgi:hypothetical protein